jgi:aquaporin Z
MVMVYAGGHVSGAHYNPAVTLAVWLRGKCATAAVPGYIVMQVVAAFVVGVLKGPEVMAGAYAVGGVSGVTFNPAVVVAATAIGVLTVPTMWMYLVAEFAGAAALTFKAINPQDP